MKHYFSTRVRAVLIASVLLVVVMAILGSMIKTDVGSNVVQGILSRPQNWKTRPAVRTP